MKEWRLGIFNGVMLACYFIPTWTISAFKVVMSPVRGMYEPANIAPAMFVSDHLSWSALGLVRFAWLFALSKFLVAAFFLAFLFFVIREALSRKHGAEEALAFALTLGSLISFGSMLAASYVGEAAAIRLHATELLMLLAAGIVLLVEGGVHERASADVPYAGRPPSSVISSSNAV
ncbi:hypothetical protein AFIC_001221 [[Pseudomonas] carboxydohydrogena]|uniref:Uncharacterized protein n=1 Tax=Afipia carboxydohydrogena TaxID=290 RepID=A0ABY8BV47_AFICR|nr:hypothetical protein [[Pseudomonas] carboxydohydrogena]WEF52724.1 hypothetical protein AFIC_001221 [[Pseudomonas] carboxydohydrogena]